MQVTHHLSILIKLWFASGSLSTLVTLCRLLLLASLRPFAVPLLKYKILTRGTRDMLLLTAILLLPWSLAVANPDPDPDPQVFDGATSVAAGGFTFATDALGNGWHYATDAFGNVIAYATDIGGDAWDGGTDVAGDAWNAGTEVGGDVWHKVTEIGGEAWEIISHAGGHVATVAVDGFEMATEAAVAGGNAVADVVRHDDDDKEDKGGHPGYGNSPNPADSSCDCPWWCRSGSAK